MIIFEARVCLKHPAHCLWYIWLVDSELYTGSTIPYSLVGIAFQKAFLSLSLIFQCFFPHARFSSGLGCRLAVEERSALALTEWPTMVDFMVASVCKSTPSPLFRDRTLKTAVSGLDIERAWCREIVESTTSLEQRRTTKTG